MYWSQSFVVFGPGLSLVPIHGLGDWSGVNVSLGHLCFGPVLYLVLV